MDVKSFIIDHLSQMPFGCQVIWDRRRVGLHVLRGEHVTNAFRLSGDLGRGAGARPPPRPLGVTNAFRLSGDLGRQTAVALKNEIPGHKCLSAVR